MKMKNNIYLLFCCLLAASSSIAQTNLIQNGTFDETPSLLHWNKEIGSWSFSEGGHPGGMVGLNHNGSRHSDPAISQKLVGLEVGQTYTISGDFKGGAEAHLFCKGPGTKALAVDVDGKQVADFSMPTPIYQWTSFQTRFTASDTTAVLRIRGEIDGCDCDLALDNIRVVAVQKILLSKQFGEKLKKGEMVSIEVERARVEG